MDGNHELRVVRSRRFGSGGLAGAEPFSPIAHLRSGIAVGAWLLKAAPGVWDAVSAIRSGTPITDWSLVDNYRAALVRSGQPCGLWLTRGWAMPAGVVATGLISSDPYFAVGEDDGLWGERPRASHPTLSVDVELTTLPEVVRLDELLTHDCFRDAEPVRAPRVSSPIALTVAQWQLVQEIAYG